jgi:hypothetical protein
MRGFKMELLVLDTNFQLIYILDNFESAIWTERYCDCGDFEIYVKANPSLLDILKNDYYMLVRDSDYIMIIEGRPIKFDSESGSHMIVSGRSLESIIVRRIIWKQTILTGSFQNGIQTLLNQNIITPDIADRAIPNFIFEASDETAITSLTIDTQFAMGDDLLECIKSLCSEKNIGFKITMSDNMTKFIFKLYSGVDRSYNQTDYPYVVFSPKFENLLSSESSDSTKMLKNVALIGGEGDTTTKKTVVAGNVTGLPRREVYIDASNLSETSDSGTLTGQKYLDHLKQKGIEELNKRSKENKVDAELDPTRMFKYGYDYFIGDIVQVVTEYGIKFKARITEVIRSQNDSGVGIYPTFTIIDEEGGVS